MLRTPNFHKFMVIVRLSFSTVDFGSVIYLVGGFVWQNRMAAQYLATVDVYSPETDKWRDIPPMPTLILPFGVAAVNGKIYVFGGDTEDWELSPDVEVFDIGFRSVEAVGKLPVRWGR